MHASRALLLDIDIVVCELQEELPAEQLRNLWVHSYSYIGTNPLQQPAYSHLQSIVRHRGAMQQLSVVLNGISNSSTSSSTAAAARAAAAAAAIAGGAVTTRAASSSLALAAAAAAAAGPADGAVVVGVVPAAAHGAAAQMPAPMGRVTTRAAAAAGYQQLQQRQQQATHRVLGSAAVASSNQHAFNGASSSGQQQPMMMSDRSLPTPQRTALAPVGFSAAEHAARAGPAAVGAASLMAGLTGGLGGSTGLEAADPTNTPAGAAASASAAGAGSASRRATRELPARRAVVSSRYGCRSSSAAAGQGTAPAATGAGSSSAAGSSAPRGPTLVVEDSFSAGMLAAPPGSTTPASPKHTAAGHRGLAALFAGAGMAAGVRTRSSDVLLHCQQWASTDLEGLIEGTPQPPQLINPSAQLHGRMLEAVQARHGMAGKGLAAAAADQVHPVGTSGSSLLAARQAAAAAGLA